MGPRLALVSGVVAIFLGYLSVWIPGPAAGLRFIGLEVGEWLKFLGVGPIRNVFYLPPFTLGCMMLMLSAGWTNRRWQSWVWRGLGAAASLLAFPAYEDLLGSSRAEYLPRVWMVAVVVLLFVGITAVGLTPWARRHKPFAQLLVSLCGFVGVLLPLWLFGEVRPTVALVIGSEIGYGFGVWLNAAGHILIAAVALYAMRTTKSAANL